MSKVPPIINTRIDPFLEWQFKEDAHVRYFDHRFETDDLGCILCQFPKDKCECTPQKWKGQTALEIISRLEEEGTLRWFRIHVIGDAFADVNIHIPQQYTAHLKSLPLVAMVCAARLWEWCFDHRIDDLRDRLCVGCEQVQGQCKCTKEDWAMVDVRDFVLELCQRGRVDWVVQHMYLVQVKEAPRPRRACRGKKDPDYSHGGSRLRSTM